MAEQQQTDASSPTNASLLSQQSAPVVQASSPPSAPNGSNANGDAGSMHPSPEPNQSGTAPSQVTPPTNPWGSIELDKDTESLLARKGWRAPVDALRSYKALEEKLSRTVPVLQKDATPQQREEFYQSLGRPQIPQAYEIDNDLATASGMHPDFLEDLRMAGWNGGLSADQMKIMFNALASRSAERSKMVETEYEKEKRAFEEIMKRDPVWSNPRQRSDNEQMIRASLNRISGADFADAVMNSDLFHDPKNGVAFRTALMMVAERTNESGVFITKTDAERATISLEDAKIERQKILQQINNTALPENEKNRLTERLQKLTDGIRQHDAEFTRRL